MDFLGYVAENFLAEMSKKDADLETNYTLPDGKQIKIGSERFRATEALFQPSFLGLDQGGVHHLTFKTVMSCDTDARYVVISKDKSLKYFNRTKKHMGC